MLHFKLGTQPEIPMPFLSTALREATENHLFENSGTVNSPFLLDPFINWPDQISSISSISDAGTTISAGWRSDQTPELQDVKFVQGWIKKMDERNITWTDDNWVSRFDSTNQDIRVLPNGTLVMNLTELELNYTESNDIPLLATYISQHTETHFFSFGFLMSYKINNNPQTYYGSVDPLIKITNNG